MASSLGRVTAAIASVHNENSAALVNFNVDFSLVKLEAPTEYSTLGNTISKKRKFDAEEGTLHQTARRLGALFKDVLPTTDELCRAYGTRVSEICSIMPNLSKQGHGPDGIFGNHLGLDGTSIWAAATSGSAAIAAHLLACMLARIFTDQEAIALWVELVQKRKEWIRGKQENLLYSTDHRNEMLASQQEITRNDLATWDASARAWLQSADQAKKRQQIQTMLILNNTTVPVNSEPQTYNSVLKAWTTALEAMNYLVKGIPQRVQDGATLLAISSWHLYPDMVVYSGSCVEVKHEDTLFQTGTLLTLGLQHVREDTKSVYWSLPLACLQYYGHPVRATRTIGAENKRISCDQFAFVILGCLFEGWKHFAVNDEDGLERLGRITDMMNLRLQLRFAHGSAPTWLIYLSIAAQKWIDAEDQDKVLAQQLVQLGRRWSTFLWNSPLDMPPPMFGLSELPALLRVLKDENQQVECLRTLSSHLELNGTDFIIQYRPNPDDQNWIEYASVVPVRLEVPPKRMLNGETKNQGIKAIKHIRWVLFSQRQLTLCIQHEAYFRDIEAAKKKLSEMDQLKKTVGTVPKPIVNEADIRLIQRMGEIREVITYSQRLREVQEAGEIFLPVIQDLITKQFKRDVDTRLIWPQSWDFIIAARDLLAQVIYQDNTTSAVSTPLIFYVGIPSLVALYSMKSSQKHPICKPILNPLFVDEFFQPARVDRSALWNHFSTAKPLVKSLIRQLRACAMMSEVYHVLPGAEISTKVLKETLTTAKWASECKDSSGLTRSQAFACIAMFDSGTCNLDPSSLSEVFALSSGNSLYIASVLLCDPFERPRSAEIRRVVGNVGKAGMTFLITPTEVKTREADPEQWMAINHTRFDGQPESHFGNTSIHLSFTNYEIPLFTDDSRQHFIDRMVVLVETLISVYDGQSWVGEVDILKTFRGAIHRVNDPDCSKQEKAQCYDEVVLKFPQIAATSVENWDELIEAPASGTIVVKAHQNWLARLAATAICVKNGFTPIILSKEVCWSCCYRTIRKAKNTHRCALIW